jgi:hypothetical protein
MRGFRSNQRPAARTTVGLVACGIAGAIALGGCTQTGSRVDAGLPEYPAELRQTTVLNIQVVRDDTDITMTNTTARAVGKARLWVNKWFSREIEGLAVGETVTLNLYDFRDPYGTQFRAGGFFATERPDRLVLAQLEPLEVEPRELLGLVVVGRSEE